MYKRIFEIESSKYHKRVEGRMAGGEVSKKESQEHFVCSCWSYPNTVILFNTVNSLLGGSLVYIEEASNWLLEG